jgi:membrane associated rhomboid family serine protease
MAFQSNGPVMLALPPFRGFTRRIILIAGCAWLAETVLGLVAGRYSSILVYFALEPGKFAHGMLWQAVTYPFLGMGLLSLLFALLTVWMFGSRVEDDRGTRWMAEYFFSATIGGAVIATTICYVVNYWGARWVTRLTPANLTAGLWPAVMAILVAFAYFNGDAPIRLYFVLTMKAKTMVALYLGFYLLLVLWSGDKLGALVALTNALCGWMFLKWVPLRGLRYAVSEKWFGMRNEFYRNKRRRAAKEFEVYMRKQGKDIRADDPHIDDSKDSNAKKWMN